MSTHQPLLLLILDGWGYSEESNGNAISNAKTPNFNKLWNGYPHALLQASGLAVGLPDGQMGNSEVGHLHIGAGRLAPQDLTRINMAVKNGDFFVNSVLTDTVDQTIKTNKALHIFGLVSNGGIHSHTDHIQAMIELAAQRGLKNIFIHAFLDGRDTPPKSALIFLNTIETTLKKCGCGKIASIVGRFYAMDRDKRWDRIEAAYDMLTLGQAEFHAKTAAEALELTYNRGETDEFVKPTCIHEHNTSPIIIQDGDSIVFMNFRSDRGRELSYAFTNKEFNDFPRKATPKLANYVTLTQYAADLDTKVAFPPIDLHNVFGEVIAKNNLHQLRIAETEKYAHVTYFFNGGEEKVFENEDRILVPSPKVTTYDLQPEMSIVEVTNKLVEAINSKKYTTIICNFANPDMVGHTGNFEAAIKAIEYVDICLGRTIEALNKVGGELVVIADHGNAEKMYNAETHQAHTAHTCAPVPFIYMGRNAEIIKTDGSLIDVSPTLLYLLDIEKPKEMTGHSLVNLK
jgi:2,3-bisphosphoglycerate-independent phosphoglycerate mutase